jgi:hypothetical protein
VEFSNLSNTAYSEKHTKPINTCCKNNAELFNVKAAGRPTYGCHCDLDLKDRTHPNNT